MDKKVIRYWKEIIKPKLWQIGIPMWIGGLLFTIIGIQIKEITNHPYAYFVYYLGLFCFYTSSGWFIIENIIKGIRNYINYK